MSCAPLAAGPGTRCCLCRGCQAQYRTWELPVAVGACGDVEEQRRKRGGSAGCWFGPAELGSEVGSSTFHEGLLVASTCEGEELCSRCLAFCWL